MHRNQLYLIITLNIPGNSMASTTKEILYLIIDYSEKTKKLVDKTLLSDDANFILQLQRIYPDKIIHISFFSTFGNFTTSIDNNLEQFLNRFTTNELKFDKTINNTNVLYGIVNSVSICKLLYPQQCITDFILVTASGLNSINMTEEEKKYLMQKGIRFEKNKNNREKKKFRNNEIKILAQTRIEIQIKSYMEEMSKNNMRLHTLWLSEDRSESYFYCFPEYNFLCSQMNSCVKSLNDAIIAKCNYLFKGEQTETILSYYQFDLKTISPLFTPILNKNYRHNNQYHLLRIKSRTTQDIYPNITYLEKTLALIPNCDEHYFQEYENVFLKNYKCLHNFESIKYILELNKYLYLNNRCYLYNSCVSINYVMFDNIERRHINKLVSLENANNYYQYCVTINSLKADQAYLNILFPNPKGINLSDIYVLLQNLQVYLDGEESSDRITIFKFILPRNNKDCDRNELISLNKSFYYKFRHVKQILFDYLHGCDDEVFCDLVNKIFSAEIDVKKMTCQLCDVEYGKSLMTQVCKGIDCPPICNYCCNSIYGKYYKKNKQKKKSKIFTPISFSCPFCRVINYEYLGEFLNKKLILLLHRVKDRDPNKRYCVCEECSNIFSVKSNCNRDLNYNDSNISSDVNTISQSKTLICKECIENRLNSNLNDLGKRCPGCLMYVHKIDGCNHIIHEIGNFSNSDVVSCRCEWCYNCCGVLRDAPFKSQIICKEDLKYCDCQGY